MPAPLLPDVKRMLSEKSYGDLKRALAGSDFSALARAWGSLAPFDRVVVFKLFPEERALALFEALPASDQALLLGTLDAGALGPVLEDLGPAVSAPLFEKLSEKAVERMMSFVQRPA